MADSVREYLRRDLACEGLLECVHGLSDLDRTVFGVLADASAPLSVDEVAERVGRERSTAYRSISRLEAAGLVDREQVNHDHGGYHHVYRPTDPGEVADEMRRLLDDWYDELDRLVEEFREEYGGRVRAAPAER